MTQEQYTAKSIEVLNGLDPVKRRPGMFTDTNRPNHLAQEAIDNSVDEAIAGFADLIKVTLFQDGSIEVIDNGRGMPVDIHPEEEISGVEVILTKLHAGAKFSNKDYHFSGGLHGVGVSVVNALSDRLIVQIKRDEKLYQIEFKNGIKTEELKVVGSVGKRNTGTLIRFWPTAQYFDSSKFLIPNLKHILRSKAVLCPGLRIKFKIEGEDNEEEWYYENGIKNYLSEAINGSQSIPQEPFIGHFEGDNEALDWAIAWVIEGDVLINESYVNLIPTAHGGTHVNGFRTGLLASLKEYCEFRNLIPRGVRLSADDLWEGCNYVLSVKMLDPQFSGQTKERLSSRQSTSFISGIIKDAFSIWLNENPQIGNQVAEWTIKNAQHRISASKKVIRKKITSGPALPGKLTDCILQTAENCELFLVEGDSAGGSAKQARDRQFQAVMPLRGKILNTWEVESSTILNSKEIHDISVAIGVDPASDDLSRLRYGKICVLADADSDGAHIATLICALMLRHFYSVVKKGHVYIAKPPLYRLDFGKKTVYALDENEKQAIIKRIKKENPKANVSAQRFKGLGEMNPIQLRETTMAPETRSLIRLTIESDNDANQVMDMLLAKKRANDRKAWLEDKGNLAEGL